MNHKDLTDRRALLVATQQKLIKQRDKISGDIIAHSGAIQDCDYWLGTLAAPKPAPTDNVVPIAQANTKE